MLNIPVTAGRCMNSFLALCSPCSIGLRISLWLVLKLIWSKYWLQLVPQVICRQTIWGDFLSFSLLFELFYCHRYVILKVFSSNTLYHCSTLISARHLLLTCFVLVQHSTWYSKIVLTAILCKFQFIFNGFMADQIKLHTTLLHSIQ